jgi:ATP-dependent DNA helicase RecQ
LEPRIWWPKPALVELDKVLPGALDRFENGRPKMVIPERLRAQAGRVLCMYGDAGWGHEVALGKYQTGLFSDALVTAAVELIQSKWKPEPPPQWVTAIPSRRHAELVRDFAQRLAASLGLPFVPALRQLRETQPQKEMRSSTLQMRNVLRAFEVAEAPALVPSGADASTAGFTGMFERLARRVGARFGNGPTLPPVPVLLVDDMVDSGWTLTLAAVLLQHHGSGPVYPFALAKASPRGG